MEEGSDLVELVLGGPQGLGDAVQLDAPRQQVLAQQGLLLLQPAQLPLGATHLVLLAPQVQLLGADLALQGRDLGGERGRRWWRFKSDQQIPFK